MNTIKKIASELNLFQFSDIPAEYTSKQLLNGSKWSYADKVHNNYTLPSDLLKKYEHGLFWKCHKQYKNNSNEVELYVIEHSEILFLSPKGNLIRLSNNKGKYFFSLDYSYYRKVDISHYFKVSEIKKSGLTEPNLIGSFTDKKINDWFSYLDKLAELHSDIIEKHNSKNSEIEAEIKTFIDSVKCKVSKWSDKTEVKTNLFTVTFTHSKKDQYLRKEIIFHGSLFDVAKISNV